MHLTNSPGDPYSGSAESVATEAAGAPAAETGQAGVHEISGNGSGDAVRALNRFDPADWADGAVSADEIVRAICDALNVRIRTERRVAISGDLNRRSWPASSTLESVLRRQ
jgi:hypothetical protein